MFTHYEKEMIMPFNFYKLSFCQETPKAALKPRTPSFDSHNQDLQHHWFVQHLPPCSWKGHDHEWGWIYCFNHHPQAPPGYKTCTPASIKPDLDLSWWEQLPKPSGAISRFARWISGPLYFMLMYPCNSPHLFKVFLNLLLFLHQGLQNFLALYNLDAWEHQNIQF